MTNENEQPPLRNDIFMRLKGRDNTMLVHEQSCDMNEEFVSAVRADLYYLDDDEEEHEVGFAEGLLLRVGAMVNSGEEGLQLCDAHSAEALAAYLTMFYDDDEHNCRRRHALIDAIDEPIELNVLYIDTMGIVPAFRGKNLGLKFLMRLTQQFSGLGYVLIRPRPETHLSEADAARYAVKDFKLHKTFARTRLCQHAALLGFERLSPPDATTLTPPTRVAVSMDDPEGLGGYMVANVENIWPVEITADGKLVSTYDDVPGQV